MMADKDGRAWVVESGCCEMLVVGVSKIGRALFAKSFQKLACFGLSLHQLSSRDPNLRVLALMLTRFTPGAVY